ncbi:chromate transporter [Cohnella sp. CIP 111063]|uniref:chromate transporter n=1 Tax=unclassified Cohnella TaxID=2636738 RepID=UPI000B8BB971|nr:MULTISPECIES: chromate transporter [unclassified Cohnella]OXS59198.1 chromate transporter [Cohnella sp. CIP 111063]PRX72208.1 chromate transporter [Cohnella sp. SGD-V74]
MKANWKLIGSLFATFLRMGPLTFGGGYALIPVIEKEIVEKRKWLQSEEVADIVAVSGSVPGAVAVNSATLIGYRIAGLGGALSALLGIFLPTFVLMIGLSLVYVQMKDNPKIEAAFLSIRATVVAMIVYAAIKIGKTAVVDFATGALAAVAVCLLLFGGSFVHPVWVIVFGALAGIAVVKIRALLGRKTKLEEKEPVYDYMI